MSEVEFNVVYWEDDVGGKLKRVDKRMDEYAYKIVGIGEWKALIADEDKTVEKGKPEVIRIKKVEFPPNSVCFILGRMRHALGAVIDVLHGGIPRYVETVSYADRVIFLPICDGEVKKNDLLGVVDLVYVKPVKKMQILDKIRKIFEPDVEKLVESKDWPYLFSK